MSAAGPGGASRPDADYRGELGRKGIHLTSALIPIVYSFISQRLALLILVPLLGVMILIELLRFASPGFRVGFQRWFGFMLRRTEHDGLSGATWVLLAAVLTVWIYPKRIAIAVLFMLSVCDSLAALLGRRFGGGLRFGEKSLVGSGAFFASALLITWWNLPHSPVLAIFGAAVGTLVEALPLRLGRVEVNDNLSIPLLTGAALWVLAARFGDPASQALLRGM